MIIIKKLIKSTVNVTKVRRQRRKKMLNLQLYHVIYANQLIFVSFTKSLE